MASLFKDSNKLSADHKRMFLGNKEELEHALQSSTTVYIENMSLYTTEEQVYELFSCAGELKNITMGLDSNTKTPCGFCFVTYYSRQEAENSVKYISGTILDDRPILVELDWGFQETRRWGRGQSGEQLRDEYWTDYVIGRGGNEKLVQKKLEAQRELLDYDAGPLGFFAVMPSGYGRNGGNDNHEGSQQHRRDNHRKRHRKDDHRSPEISNKDSENESHRQPDPDPRLVDMTDTIDVPPGPVDPLVLYNQASHISEEIWKDRLEDGIMVKNYNRCPDLHPRVLYYIHMAGFYGLYQLGFVRVDHPLISALVERWRPETHTFHLPPGECTVTLQDIEILGGVRVDGPAVTRSESDDHDDVRLDRIERLLGKRPGPGDYKKPGVKFSWLRQHFTHLPDDADDATVRCFARAAIVLLLGSQYLSDKSGAIVSLMYLPFLEDLDACSRYSWGSAILACLYRNLCRAAIGTSGLAGPVVLLQFWAWSRFMQVRPCRSLLEEQSAGPNMPRFSYGHRWASAVANYSSEVVAHNLRHYRDQFDMMRPEQMVWEPYADVLDTLPDYCKTGHGIWYTRAPLVFLEIVEFHFPDRVLRQFGMRQCVPVDCDRDDKMHIMDRHGHTREDWPRLHAKYLDTWNARHQLVVLGVYHHGYGTVKDDYMAWYQRITRRYIGRAVVVAPDRGFQPSAGRIAVMENGLRYAYTALKRNGTAADVQFMDQLFAQLQLDAP